MAKEKKNGPLTQSEKTFIQMNMKDLSPQQIAEELNRNVNTIASFITSLGFDSEKNNILILKKREDWPMIKDQLTDEEATLFEWHWNEIIKQFGAEVKFTESMQIVNAIKHEILGNRALTSQRQITRDMEDIREDILRERDKPNPDFQMIESWERTLGSLAETLDVNNREYRESNKKLSEVLEKLKANRDQRLAKVEDSRKSFPSWMQRLMEDKEVQKTFGRYIAKMKLSIDFERYRLGSIYKYADNTLDRPLLNEETIKIETEINEL